LDLTVINTGMLATGVTLGAVGYLTIYFVINGVRNLIDRL